MAFPASSSNGDGFERVQVTGQQSVADVIRAALSGNGVQRVFGEPVEKGGRTIVPIADIGSTFGFGGGSGTGPAVEAGSGTGEGSGGGGKFGGRPIGYLDITDERIRFVPTIDITKIATWSILAGTFLLWMIIRKR